ncbi:MAG: hypothetical protein ACRYGM_04095 [Janthinobacterium lividum]
MAANPSARRRATPVLAAPALHLASAFLRITCRCGRTSWLHAPDLVVSGRSVTLTSALVPVSFLRHPAAMSSSTHTLPPVRPVHPAAEERYRVALQAIAAGRPGMGRAMTGVEAQELARRALVEAGEDWTKRGAPAEGEAAETPS